METDSRVSSSLKESDPNSRLTVEIFGRTLPSPLILGSGTLVEKFEEIEPYLKAGAGAVVPRSTRKFMLRTVHPSPHLYQSGRKGNEMMLNAEWTGAAIDYWNPYLEQMSQTQQVIMSISGRDIGGCVDVCRTLDRYNFPWLEVNVSCAHSNDAHGFITRNGEHIRDLISSIKDAGVSTPLTLKLGHSDLIVPLANIAKEAGVDGIVALNTFGPLLDFTIDNDGNPQSVLGIGGAKGGMSGAPLFNIALTDVAEIVRQIGIPVIGCGGVRTAEDVVKMMMAGASAVQVYTAAHVRGINGPSVFTDLNSKLIKLMSKKNIDQLAEVQGRALSLLSQSTNLEPLIPVVLEQNCTGCKICGPVCLPQAISFHDYDGNKGNLIAIVDDQSCVGCGHCVNVCPTNALEI